MVSSVLRMTLAVRLSFVRDCCAIFSVHRQRLDFAAWLVLFRQQRGSWSAGYTHSRNHWKLWDVSMPPRRLQAVTQAIEFEHSLLTEWASLVVNLESETIHSNISQRYSPKILQKFSQQTSISGPPTSFFSVAWAPPWFPSQSLLPAGASLGRRLQWDPVGLWWERFGKRGAKHRKLRYLVVQLMVSSRLFFKLSTLI